MPLQLVAKVLGPYRPLLWILLAGLVLLSGSRLLLVFWQIERVSTAIDLPRLFIQGVRADLIIMGLLLIPVILLMPVFANRPCWRVWCKLVIIWGTFTITLLVFMEVSTPAFIIQYDLRPNRLFVEYLAYPKEVFSTLWEGFRIPLLLGSVLTVLAAWTTTRLLIRHLSNYRVEWPVWKLMLVWLGVLAVQVTINFR